MTKKQKKLSQIQLDHLNSHGRPLSRRDFITRGLMQTAGFCLLPTFGLSLLKRVAADETDPSLANNPETKFIVFDLAGGAGLCGNFLFGKGGGPKDLLKGYTKLGWNPKSTKWDERFGLPMPDVSVSKVLEGMLSVMSVEAQQRFKFASLLHTSLADTSSNALSAINSVALVGLGKPQIPSPVGLSPGFSGGNSRTITMDPQYKAFVINNVENLIGALAPPESLRSFSNAGLEKLVGSIQKTSDSQARELLNNPLTQKQVDFLSTNFDQVKSNLLVNKAFEMDPRRDPIFTALYAINANTAGNNVSALRAAMVMNHFKGISGPCAITIEGCDYHNGTQATGDAKDREIGVELGRAIEAAHRMKVPLFIQMITDGGIYSDDNTRVWRGDTQESSTIVGYYNPAKPPEYFSPSSIQLGAYTDGQGVDRSTMIGDSPVLASYAVIANYMSVSGRRNEFQKYFPNTIKESDLDTLQIFDV